MLDFSKRKKKYFDVTLHDGTKLQIPTPTMEVNEAIAGIAKKDDIIKAEEAYPLVKKILGSNTAGAKITDKQLKAFDLADIYDLFINYMEFIHEIISDPN